MKEKIVKRRQETIRDDVWPCDHSYHGSRDAKEMYR
jgi:hypothetical protein